MLPLYIAALLSIPFGLFSVWSLVLALRRRILGAVLYWIFNIAFLMCVNLVSDLIGPFGGILGVILGAIYGILLFVVWWLKPDYYFERNKVWIKD